MEEQFNVFAKGPDGEAYEVVFNATSLEVALEALVSIAENAPEIFEQAGKELSDAADEE